MVIWYRLQHRKYSNSIINSSLRFSNYCCLASFVLIAPLILFFRADRENTLAVHLRTCVTVFNPSLWPQIFYLHSIRRSQPIRGLTPKKRETTEFVELFAKPTHDGCWWWGWCWKWRHHRNGCFSEPGKGGGAEKRNILGGEKEEHNPARVVTPLLLSELPVICNHFKSG